MNPAFFLRSNRETTRRPSGLAAAACAGLCAWLILAGGSILAYADTPLIKPTPDLAAGKEAFVANCARCHGETGAGNGPDAAQMDPKPRNIAEGVFKFRTTASGTVPTDEDLFHTISTGLPGSRMPEFQRLPEETRWQLVYFVKSLAPVFLEENSKAEVVNLGNDPGPEKAGISKGKELYTQLGCTSCHGNAGRGDGPSAATLTDNWGNPIRPANLTQGWNYRGGSNPKEIVARIMTGIDGTPMPSYADAISSKEDAWALAYYVNSLQKTPLWNRTIEAKITQRLPETAQDPMWNQVSRTDLRLSNQLYKEGQIQPVRVNAISVQAVYNEEAVVFRLQWDDPDESRQTPPDAFGIVLMPKRVMKWEVGSLRSWPASQDAPSLDVSYWSAGKNGAAEAVVQETAELETGKTQGETLAAEASYADGQWTMLLNRPFQPLLKNRVALDSREATLIGLMVWDGGNQEQGRRRSNSNWVDLVLK